MEMETKVLLKLQKFLQAIRRQYFELKFTFGEGSCPFEVGTYTLKA